MESKFHNQELCACWLSVDLGSTVPSGVSFEWLQKVPENAKSLWNLLFLTFFVVS